MKDKIKSAFLCLSVHPSDFDLLGFGSEGGFNIDCDFPMGYSLLCTAFEKFNIFGVGIENKMW